MTKGMAWHSGNAWQVKHCSQHYNTPTALPQLWYEGKIFTNSTSLPLRKENQRTLLRALHYITCCTFYKFSEIYTSEDSWPHSFLLSMFNFLFLSSVFGEAIFSIRKNSKWQGTPCQETAGGRCMPAELMDHPSTTPAPGPSLHPPHQHLTEVPQSYNPYYKHNNCQEIGNPSLAKPQGNVSSRKSTEEGSERPGGALLQGLQELSSEHFTSAPTEKANTTDWPQGTTLNWQAAPHTTWRWLSVPFLWLSGKGKLLCSYDTRGSKQWNSWASAHYSFCWQSGGQSEWFPATQTHEKEVLRTKYKRLLLTAFTFQL